MASDDYKKDGGKPMVSLVPRELVEAVARVLEFGAKKYSRNGWRTVAYANPEKVTYSRSLDAAMRHLNAVASGEEIDPESGLPHLAHAACDIGFLLEYKRLGLGTDDLYRVPVSVSSEGRPFLKPGDSHHYDKIIANKGLCSRCGCADCRCESAALGSERASLGVDIKAG